MKQKTVLIIVGPTASGKTTLSLELAAHFKTDIVSADSRQCYKELNIGVAKPPGKDLQIIKHYFINSHSIHDEVNAQVFEEYALNAVDEIFKKKDVAIMVGGTGMYIKAFCEGLDEIPAIAAAIRKNIVDSFTEKGLTWLQSEIEKEDPVFWQHAEQKNPQRLMRALEVKTATGKSITEFRNYNKKERSFKIIKFGIDLSKQLLHNNINQRVDEMISCGLIDEAKHLIPYKNLQALQTVGYKEIFEYFDGSFSVDKAILKIKSNTRQYAKRQLTWFKKDKDIKWIVWDEMKNSILKILF